MKKSKNTDPAHDVLGYERQPLDAIFRPETVAVIGASERAGSVGRTLMWNLVSNPFGGTVYPVNPNRPNVLGIKTYPSIKEVPEQVDLAVIVAPAPAVPGIISECVDAGVAGAVIISAGFREVGPEGEELRAAGHGTGPAEWYEDHGSQLPRRHEPRDRLERDLRRVDGPPGECGGSQPERGAPDRDTRQELSRRTSAFRRSLRWGR